MSDLQTAVAAVLRNQIKSRGWVTPETMADAVIRELGLMQQWKALTENGEEMTVDSGENLVTRYISDWRSIHD